MNAIPLINNAPRPNINVGSIGSPAFNPVAAGAKLGGSIGGNVMRQNPASMPENNETQLRQEINTSLVALKKEAGTLEGLISEAAQMLIAINKRITTLEAETVKKSDVVDAIQSGNNQPVTSNAVYNASPTLIGKMEEGTSDVTDGTEFVSSYASDSGFAETNEGGPNKPYKRKFIKVWNYIKAKISSWMDSIPTSGSSNPITSGGVFSALGDKTKYYYTSIGSYSVNSKDTISPQITDYCHTAPQGYKAIRLLYADGDNYFHTTINYVSGRIYATITNNYIGSISATFYVLELFVED